MEYIDGSCAKRSASQEYDRQDSPAWHRYYCTGQDVDKGVHRRRACAHAVMVFLKKELRWKNETVHPQLEDMVNGFADQFDHGKSQFWPSRMRNPANNG